MARVELPLLYNWRHALPFPIYSGIITELIVDEEVLNIAAKQSAFFMKFRRESLEKNRLCRVENIEIPFLVLKSIYFSLYKFDSFETNPLRIAVGGETVADIKWHKDGLPKQVGPHVVAFRDIYLPEDLHDFLHSIHVLHLQGKTTYYDAWSAMTLGFHPSFQLVELPLPEVVKR